MSALAGIACVSCAAIVGIEDKDPFPEVAESGGEDARSELTIVTTDGAPPDTSAKIETVISGQAGVFGIVLDDSYLYFTNETLGRVFRRSASGGAVETIALDQAEPREIMVDGTRVFWHAWNTAGRTQVDGGAEVPILVSMRKIDIGVGGTSLVHEGERAPTPFRGVALASADDGFFVVAGAQQVIRYRRGFVGPNGDVASTAGPVVRAPTAVAADDVYFYWFQQNTFDLWRRPKTAVANMQPPPERFSVLPGTPDVTAMIVDSHALYFVTGGGIAAKVSTAADAASDAGDAGVPMIELAIGFPSPRGLAEDAKYLYFTHGDANGQVVAVPKAGGAGIVLATGQSRPRGIAVRGDGTTRWIYWAENGTGAIKRTAAPP
jgi:hypothetical protein